MSQIDILANAGQQILDGVTAAINSGDFTHLSSDIGNAVTEATNGIITQAKHPSDVYRTSRVVEPGSSKEAESQKPRHPQTTVNRAVRVSGGTGTAQARTYAVRSPFQQRLPSKLAGLGRIIGGSIGALSFGIPAVATLIVGLTASTFAFIGTGICGAFALLSGAFIAGGSREYKLVQRFYRYSQIVGDAEYVTFSDLSVKSGIPEKTVRRDITRLRQMGYLTNATTDAANTTLMLTDKVHKEYIENEAKRKEMEAQKAARKEAILKEDAKTAAYDATLPENAKQVLSDGKEYLVKVRDYNDLIPDEEMSKKLDVLEEIMKRIFDQVRNQPDSARDLRRFMNYYLPTTDKLLGAYVEAQKTGSEAENIATTKREIESALDMINQAFEQLLNNLFETRSWDVSSDISVMKAMMTQDGLVPEGAAAGGR